MITTSKRNSNYYPSFALKTRNIEEEYNDPVRMSSLLNKMTEGLEQRNSQKSDKGYIGIPEIKPVNSNSFKNGVSVTKKTDTTPVLPKITENTNTPQKQGGLIKNNIKSVLSHIYGEPDTKHLFDDIDDEDVEKNIPVAESAIQTNIDRGNLSKEALAKLPNLRDGMTLFYAASDKGNNRAATKAREAAYTEWASPTLKEVERTLKATKKTNSDVKSDHKGSEKEKPSLALNSYSGKNSIGSVNLKNNLNYPVTKNLMPGMDDLDRLILPADSEVSLEKIKNDFDYSEEKSYPEESEKEDSFWDAVSTILAAASLIPGADMVTNLLSIPVDLIRGDYLSAGLDALGVIPFAGEFADAAKVAGKVDDVADIVNAAKKTEDVKDVINAGGKFVENSKIVNGFNDGVSMMEAPGKSSALNSISDLPSEIQKNAKSFFKGSSNNYNNYSVIKNKDNTYAIIMENPGKVPGSKAVYVKIIDSNGNTIRVYKDTFDPSGKLIHRKDK